MLFWILFTAASLMSIACLVFFIGGLVNQTLEGLSGIALGMALLVWPPCLISMSNHAHDLAKHKYASEYREIIRDNITELENQLKDYTHIKQTSLINHDAPVMALVSAKQEKVTQLLQIENNLVNTKSAIYERSIGLMSGTLVFFDTPKELL